MAALRLSWYKFKHHYMDFIKVLFGILIFEGLIIYIQKKEFLTTFENTRMTLFLLLFSSSLLILVQNSIYISKERAILNRDFFSTLNRWAFVLASLVFHTLFALVETMVFVSGFHWFSELFDKTLETKGQVLGNFSVEIGITVFLVFICAHFMALLISSLVGSNDNTSVILSVILGIMQFSLSGTVLQLPKGISGITSFIFLSYGHKAMGMTNHLATIKSAMAKFQVPLPKSQLELFEASSSAMISHWTSLLGHAFIHALLFLLVLTYKKEKS
ncbi:ABC transporter permease [Streptococcus thoraltensis]|uniref:ABC transporter permease n=1 Tax=Streptococcus thoraltensis TaxID=55085 RepID=UPI00037CC98B|nr:ABC transporter permease [Streptococcus thoraltensis]MDY4761353.1 ABC transporter permease [Streptococcus thoraltensis]